MDHARRGEDALAAKNNAEAVTHFSAAIAQSPTAVSYYIKRSTARQRCQQYADALADADLAVSLAVKRAKRELIAQAQLRRGIALFHLQRYGDAKACFGWAKKFDEKEKLVGIWEGQVAGKLRGLGEDDEKVKATVEENPNAELPSEPSSSAAASNGATSTTVGDSSKATNGSAAAPTTQPPATQTQTPASKIRHEWYQNNDNVYVTLLAKGVPKDKASIDIEAQSLSISFPLATGSTYDFSLQPLHAPVDTVASLFKIFSTKIEITLKKTTPGEKWPSLEGTHKYDGSASETKNVPSVMRATQNVSSTPSYPTSSRSGPKNWDKIASSYSKPKNKDSEGGETEKTEKDDLYVDDFDDEGDEANAFFKKLYAGASDETKRAMMKSYQESGGTALSTNWEEVSKGPVPVTPPDGMEERKWEK